MFVSPDESPGGHQAGRPGSVQKQKKNDDMVENDRAALDAAAGLCASPAEKYIQYISRGTRDRRGKSPRPSRCTAPDDETDFVRAPDETHGRRSVVGGASSERTFPLTQTTVRGP